MPPTPRKVMLTIWVLPITQRRLTRWQTSKRKRKQSKGDVVDRLAAEASQRKARR